MNLPEQLRRPSAHHAFWLLLPRAGRQSKRESLDGIEHNAHVMHEHHSNRCLLIINWFVHSQLPQKRLSSGRRFGSRSHTLPTSISRVGLRSLPTPPAAPWINAFWPSFNPAASNQRPPSRHRAPTGIGAACTWSIDFAPFLSLLHHHVFRVSAETVRRDIQAGVDLIAPFKFRGTRIHWPRQRGKRPIPEINGSGRGM